MESQSDDDFEYDDDEDVDAYYAEGQDEIEPEDEREPDPENYEYTCLTVDRAKAFLAKEVQTASEVLKVTYPNSTYASHTELKHSSLRRFKQPLRCLKVL